VRLNHEPREHRVRAILLLLSSLLLGGCGPAESPDAESPAPAGADTAAGALERRPATLRFHGDSAQVTVPAEARAGEPLRVSLTTYGGGCTREDTTEVRVIGLVADVTPYQLAPREGSAMVCTMELRLNRRDVDVLFEDRGAAMVRVIGVSQPGDSAMRIERKVTVR
jgi:hypothetical protein